MRCNVCVLFLLIFCAQTVGSNANPRTSGGLRFRDNSYGIQQRTSYSIFRNGSPRCNDFIEMDFDLSLSNTSMIGYLLTCKSGEQDIFNLVATNYRNEGLNINLNVHLAKQRISIPVDTALCAENIWHRVSILLSFKSGVMVLKLDDKADSVRFDPIQLRDNQPWMYVFGVCGHYLDVSGFAIRNLRFNRDDKESYLFPLNEYRGSDVHSDNGDPVGVVTNPDWIHKYHYRWDPIAEFDENEISAVFHDPVNGRIVMYNSKNALIYDIAGNRFHTQEHKFENPFAFLKGGGINYSYDENTQELFLYNNLLTANKTYTTAQYNYIENTLEFLGKSHIRNRRHHNSCFRDRDNKYVYQFGGYGDFKYYNLFYRFDFRSRKWKQMSFLGDSIAPRYYTSVACDFSGDEDNAYLFGGYGNESGRQEDGGRYFNDLYKINISQGVISKIAEFRMENFDMVPCRDQILDKANSSFLTLCYSQYKPDSFVRLYNFNYGTGEYYPVSDSIPLVSLKISTRVHLFEDKAAGKYICVIQEFTDPEQAKLKLYSLLTPAMTWSDIENLSGQPQKAGLPVKVIIAVIVLLLAGFAVYVIRKRKTGHPIPDKVPMDKEEDENLKLRPNSIYLLGDLTVIDRNGKDISYLFSSKIRQLFLLIFTYSAPKHSLGVTSNEIASILWPGKDLSKSRNIRGVNVRHLRNILSDIDGVSLLHCNSKWFLEIDENLCYCDYLHIISFDEKNMEGPETDYCLLKPYVSVLRRGNLLKTENHYWLDAFKAEFEETLLTKFYPILSKAFGSSNFYLSYKLSQILLTFDYLNEELMKIEVNSLIGLGDPVKAHMRFRQFAINYYQSYSKNLIYEDFIGHNS